MGGRAAFSGVARPSLEQRTQMSYPNAQRRPRRAVTRGGLRTAFSFATIAAALLLACAARADDKPAAPPAGAVVLFDGKDLLKWQKYPAGGDATWKLVDGAMEVAMGDIITRDKFRDMKLHLEFMPPHMPDATL